VLHYSQTLREPTDKGLAVSHESYVTVDVEEAIVLNCDRCGIVRTFPLAWDQSISVEHIYAVWLAHLGATP